MTTDLYRRHDGQVVRVRDLADAHLVNALLRALGEAQPAAVTEPLAAEVVRRGLVPQALALVPERDGSTNRFWRIYRTPDHRAQYAVRRTALGYAVTRWSAAGDRLDPMGLFEWKDYADGHACREAASAYACRLAKEEER